MVGPGEVDEELEPEIKEECEGKYGEIASVRKPFLVLFTLHPAKEDFGGICFLFLRAPFLF